MDDDLGLLPGQEPASPRPRRPIGLLLGGLVVVALLAVAGVFWMVASLADRGGNVTAAGSTGPAPATTMPPTTPAVATVPPTTADPSSAPPLQSAATVIATTPPPAPKPTTAPAPTPRPTLSVPVGRLVRVPDVVGLRVQQASTVLRTAGFAVQVIGGVQDPGRDDRRVVAQRPTAGTVVRAGSTVILVTDGT